MSPKMTILNRSIIGRSGAFKSLFNADKSNSLHKNSVKIFGWRVLRSAEEMGRVQNLASFRSTFLSPKKKVFLRKVALRWLNSEAMTDHLEE